MTENPIRYLRGIFAAKNGLDLPEELEAEETCVPKALEGAVGAPMPNVLKCHRMRMIRGNAWTAFRIGMEKLVQTKDPKEAVDQIYGPDQISDDIKNIFDLIRLGRRSNTEFGDKLRNLHVDPASNLSIEQIETILSEGSRVIVLGTLSTGEYHAMHITKSPRPGRFTDTSTGLSVTIRTKSIAAIVFRNKK